ncbi:hypothetical protein GQ54DRAFT_205262 [Martensiomyces pterosporus]|nr:hypothetical protein GQ54DRAFT_205262 [Martensiomyces pterosporus]
MLCCTAHPPLLAGACLGAPLCVLSQLFSVPCREMPWHDAVCWVPGAADFCMRQPAEDRRETKEPEPGSEPGRRVDRVPDWRQRHSHRNEQLQRVQPWRPQRQRWV